VKSDSFKASSQLRMTFRGIGNPATCQGVESKPMPKLSSSPVTDLVGSCSMEIRPIMRALRTAVRANFEQVREFVYHGAICYAPRETPTVFFVFIAPQRGYVRLAFTRGAELPDPAGLLEGTGARMRHVKVRSVADAKRPELVPLIRAAARPGAAGVA
jgi:hypothetical protein